MMKLIYIKISHILSQCIYQYKTDYRQIIDKQTCVIDWQLHLISNNFGSMCVTDFFISWKRESACTDFGI